MVTFSSSDLRALVIAAVVLGILFGYDDQQPTFQLSYWLTNLIIMIVLSFFSLMLYDAAHKIKAKRAGCESSIHLWSMSRFSYAASSHLRGPIKSIPLGIIIPLLFLFLTEGVLKVATLTSTSIKTISARRLGKEFRRATELEEAQIACAGPLMSLFIAFLAKIIIPFFPFMQQVMAINLYLAFFNMLPLPTLDGTRVFFGSPLMFSFFFTMALLAFFFLRAVAPLTTFLFALVVALGVLLVHYNNRYIK